MSIVYRLVNCLRSTESLSSLSTFKQSVNFIRKMSQSTESSICTHSGNFHCDDVLACYLLKQLPEFKNSTIIRSRDDKVIDSSDIVVDVGGVYDHRRKRYDHHQRGFKHTLNSLDPRKPFKIKLSSAGLIYHHYGRRIISQLLDLPVGDSGDSHDGEKLEILFDKIYESFILEVDAIDNGIDMYDGEPKYSIHSGLSSRVSYLEPAWNQEVNDEILYDRFLEAIKLVGSEFEDRVKYYGNAWYPPKLLVKEAILNRSSVHPSGAIIDLSSYGGIPWKEHLFTIEKELGIEGEVKFALFLSIEKNWRVCAVPTAFGSFVSRLPIHADYCGLRDEQLSQVSGIPGCIFVHTTGFIGGGNSKETCIALAEKTMNAEAKKE